VFVWFYRPVSRHDVYKPDWGYSVWMDGLVWLVPAAIVIAIGTLVWDYTHRLDPYKSIDPDKRPLEVQVVAQDWKWLFLYPEQGIATVNELAFPSQQPISLRITSDTVMNSFLIPALGGQIYAMAGMQTSISRRSPCRIRTSRRGSRRPRLRPSAWMRPPTSSSRNQASSTR
jgi:cytochrome o ubiquinol oxidase subunit 2